MEEENFNTEKKLSNTEGITEKPVSKYSKKPRTEAQMKAFEKARQTRAEKVAQRKAQKEMEKNREKATKLKEKLETIEVQPSDTETEVVEPVIKVPKKRGRKPIPKPPTPEAQKTVEYSQIEPPPQKLSTKRQPKYVIADSDSDSDTDSEEEVEQPVYILKGVKKGKTKRVLPIVKKEYQVVKQPKPKQEVLPKVDFDPDGYEMTFGKPQQPSLNIWR